MTPIPTAVTRTSLLTLQGPDALEFAHAQFTSDVRSLEAGQWQWSAWLDPKGRVQCLFHLARHDADTLTAVLRGGDAAAMAERLQRFIFRSRLTLTPHAAQPVAGGDPLPAFQCLRDGDRMQLGLGGRSLSVSPDSGKDVAWRRQAIVHGEPWLPDALLDTLLPPALGLRLLGAIRLDKGCYPGQEIAARLHYHGGHKQAMAHLRTQDACMPGETSITLESETAIDARVIDCVADDAGYDVLAVLHEQAFTQLDQASHSATCSVTLVRRFGA